MAWFKKATDADLQQSMDLAVSAARYARENGNKAREDAFHEDLDGLVEEAQKRGWTQGSGWEPARDAAKDTEQH
jgi:isopropylmalate/homocitrate/citramalate synthase